MRPEKMIGVILDRVSYDLDRIVEGTLGKIEDEPTREILSVLLRDIKDARRLTLEKEK